MTPLFALLLAAKPLWTDAPAPKDRPTAPPPSIAAVVKGAMPAVVGIIATTARAGGNDPFHDFLERMYGSGSGGATSESPVRGIGTGFFIRSDGLIATNGHVIEGATDITVQVGEDERVYRATLVGQDDATDLALLKVDGEKPFAVLPLGDSERLEVGEWVIAIGNPFGLSRSVTTGIISFKGRRDVNPERAARVLRLHPDRCRHQPRQLRRPAARRARRGDRHQRRREPVRAGHRLRHSGGATPRDRIAARLAGPRGAQLHGDLRPGIHVRRSGRELRRPGRQGRAGHRGGEGGPAARAGLRPGDVVTAFEGEAVAESYRLRWLTARATPGQAVNLRIWRSGKEHRVAVMLLEKPAAPYEAPRPAPGLRREQEPFGFAVEEPPRGDVDRGRGVRVSSVDLRSNAYRAGVREGDLLLSLNGQAVGRQARVPKRARKPAPPCRACTCAGAERPSSSGCGARPLPRPGRTCAGSRAALTDAPSPTFPKTSSAAHAPFM